MKKILIIRHATWEPPMDNLTPQGRQDALALKPKMDKFDLVYASMRQRSIQTAKLVSGQFPVTDNRIGGTGQDLASLIDEIFTQLPENGEALIVSHEITIAALEKILTSGNFGTVDKSYQPLDGFWVDEQRQISPLYL